MNHRGRWRIGALASAIALLGSLASLEVHALSLGKITIQSALGEPLRGEIDITDINPAEASSLKVGLASAEAFMAAGMDYPSFATGLEIKLQRRADGRPYLRLNSNRAITEPFMDLIVEANWASGHVTRDYTMLFDPPRAVASSTPAIAPTAPMLSRSSLPVGKPMADLAAPKNNETETPDETAGALKTPEQPAERSDPPAERAIAPIERPVPPQAAATVRAPRPAKTAPSDSSSSTGDQVVVKKGDTANKIAARNKPADVSLDQMLVALLKQNPNAFIGGNVNTIKSGAVLDMPKSETISALSTAEARKIIVAQSKDFNAFRRKLSESVAATAVASPGRQSGGTLETKVEDHATPPPREGKLTITNGAIKAGAAGKTDDKILKDKQAKDDALRVAELNKNISDLNKLGIPPATATPASRPATVPAIAVATPPGMTAPAAPAAPKASAASAASSAPVSAALPAASATVPSADMAQAIKAPASAASAAAEPLAAASAPDAAASAASAPVALKKPVVKALPEPEPEPELMDQLMDNAVPLLGGVGILGLLGGLIFMRRKKKKSKTAPVDSSFLESRLQPDSFFGASGGSRVNTNNENSLPGSSMAYTPSQMDASGDVDPVAEADVYLAYGRDEQAEDILKEALHTHPGRAAIHAKLLEIYAKRRDKNAFESLAGEAFKLTQGQGPEWAYIVELGNELDPGNALYQAREAAPDAPLQNFASASAAASAMSSAASADMDVDMDVDLDLDMDMDMDFSLDDEAPQASAAPVTLAPVPAPEPAPVIPAPEPMPPAPLMSSPASATPPSSHLDDLDLGLDFDMTPAATPPAAQAAAPAPAAASIPDLDLLSNGLDFTPMPPVTPEPVAAAKPAAAPAAAPAHDNGMMDFDLDAFSLDLTPAPAKAQEHVQTETQEEDPLEVKFMLAEEFRALGDTDGARSLADEVLAKAKGPLKTRAQSFLNELA